MTEAWIWPPGLPGPSAHVRRRAGDLALRHPAPEAGKPEALLAALRNGHRDLAAIPSGDLVRLVGAAAETLTVEIGSAGIQEVAANARLSSPMTRVILDGMAASWNTDALDRLVRTEFPDPRALDGFVAETEPRAGESTDASAKRRVRAAAPPVTLHFGAGSVPGVSVTSMIRALLVKSAVLVKPGAGDIALTVRFARLLHRADPRLAGAAAVQYWPGGAPQWESWERGLLTGADQVVVQGSGATIEAIRARAPASTRLIEHPHRIGVAIVDPVGAPGAVASTARAAALFDQRGCVSTHLVLLLSGRDLAAHWCGELAASLAATATALPAGPSTPGELSARRQLEGRVAMKAAASPAIRLWASDGAGWSVVLGPSEAFEPGGGRTVWVVQVADPEGALGVLSSLSPVLQTVGLAGLDGRAGFAEALCSLGATRIVPLDRVPFPEADWFHDGSRPLRELVRWGELR